MQKVFDVDNKEDMDLLWSILPDDVVRILKSCYTSEKYYGENNNVVGITDFFNINWHDKTEITRPVNYEDMIGCVGWFFFETNKYLGRLARISNNGLFLNEEEGRYYKRFEPAKKSDLKFYEDK